MWCWMTETLYSQRPHLKFLEQLKRKNLKKKKTLSGKQPNNDPPCLHECNAGTGCVSMCVILPQQLLGSHSVRLVTAGSKHRVPYWRLMWYENGKYLPMVICIIKYKWIHHLLEHVVLLEETVLCTWWWQQPSWTGSASFFPSFLDPSLLNYLPALFTFHLIWVFFFLFFFCSTRLSDFSEHYTVIKTWNRNSRSGWSYMERECKQDTAARQQTPG